MIRLVSVFISAVLFLSIGCSQNDKNQDLSTEKVIQIPFPIGFKKNSSEVFNGRNFSRLKNSWKKKLENKEMYMVIKGQYFQNEKNTTRSRDLGISRASELKKLLSKEIDPSRILIDCEKVFTDFTDNWQDAYSISLKQGNTENLGYTETAEIFIINYGSDPNLRAISENVSFRLNDIAEQMKNANIGANIICHTQPTSNPKADYELGKKLADEVKAFLISKGLTNEDLRSSSMGSSQPIIGKDNRRIQLIFSAN
ncbi:MAG TPA: hypothetical protein DHU89_06510 [Flavobacteriales bacterium]|nr:hypothetical protein [Flavobacteriales bacterium]